MKEFSIAILLATYNGERYIKEQIESILQQQDVTLTIYVHDDLSEDRTLQIIEEMSQIHPDNINILSSDGNLGVVNTYQFLLDNVLADYYFFSDQDDVWYLDKIVQELELLKKANFKPALVYSDLKVVDQNLGTINTSMFQHMNFQPTTTTDMLLTQNVITGNTVGINRPLRDLIVNYFRMNSKKILMHDGWLGLIASIYGEVFFLNKPTVQYRQHQNNVVGARKRGISRLFDVQSMRDAIISTTLQANELENKMCTYSTEKGLTIRNNVSAYANLFRYNRLKRLQILFYNGFKKQGTLRNILYIILIFTERKIKDD